MPTLIVSLAIIYLMAVYLVLTVLGKRGLNIGKIKLDWEKSGRGISPLFPMLYNLLYRSRVRGQEGSSFNGREITQPTSRELGEVMGITTNTEASR